MVADVVADFLGDILASKLADKLSDQGIVIDAYATHLSAVDEESVVLVKGYAREHLFNLGF